MFNKSQIIKSITTFILLGITVNAYASSTVTVVVDTPFYVNFCQLTDTGFKDVTEAYNRISLLTDATQASKDDTNLLENFCYKKENCLCTLLPQNESKIKSKIFTSDRDMQIIMAKVDLIGGSDELFLAVMIIIAIASTLFTAGVLLAWVPVIGTPIFVKAIGLYALINSLAATTLNVLLVKATLATMIILSIGISTGAWFFVNHQLELMNPDIPPTNYVHNVHDMTLDDFKNLPPALMSVNSDGAYVVPLFDGETLRITGEKSFVVDNDQIEKRAYELFSEDNGKTITVYNQGAFAMQTCYGRECTSLQAGQTAVFPYIRNQESLNYITTGPTIEPLKVQPNDYVKFWNTYKSPLYETGSSVQKIPDKSNAPICINAKLGILYVGAVCYDERCYTVNAGQILKLGYVEGELLAIRDAWDGKTVAKEGTKEHEPFIDPTDVKSGNTIDIWGAFYEPYYKAFPNTCKWENPSKPTVCAEGIAGQAFRAFAKYNGQEKEVVLGQKVTFDYVAGQSMTIETGTGNKFFDKAVTPGQTIKIWGGVLRPQFAEEGGCG
jgi:hypothetical protein